MNNLKKITLSTMVIFGLTACGGGNSYTPPPVVVVPPPPPTVQNQDYTVFVKDTFALDAMSEPVEINEITFDFMDLDNPDAYNDILNQ